ncbi:MAG: hypothetical protein U9Q99_02955 [Nanoarchaeota archaeon]|nr:hypothetical protein [Nanoarchaeota archaeon]
MVTILQAPLLTDFLYPFLLIFFIVFAVLEKTSIFGNDKKQINAMISLVIGLIFVGAVFPKMIAENMVMFMTVGMVIIFVGLVLWGFLTGQEGGIKIGDKMKIFYAWILGIALVIAIIWASGLGAGIFKGIYNLMTFLFASSWSGTFWSNVLFVGLIVGAITIALKSGKVIKKDEG